MHTVMFAGCDETLAAGLAQAVERLAAFDVIGHAHTTSKAERMIADHAPDVLVLAEASGPVMTEVVDYVRRFPDYSPLVYLLTGSNLIRLGPELLSMP